MTKTASDKDYITKRLLKFERSPLDYWTIDDATKGTSIMGGTGSGKTSASGKSLAEAYLKEGWGGVVLCAKPEEAQLWRKYCKGAQRTGDLIEFTKGAKLPGTKEDMVFNPIDFEMKRGGEGAGETVNITNIFMNIYRMGNRISSEGDTKEERYWDTALKRCLNRVIELIKLAQEDLSYANMVKVLSSARTMTLHTFTEDLEETKNLPELPKSFDSDRKYCVKCLLKAIRIHLKEEYVSPSILDGFNLVEAYFATEFPIMAEKTKSIVIEMFMGLAEPFLSGILHRHFAGSTNLRPELTYEKQKIIVLDFSIKEYLDAGIIAQSVFKLLFQQAIERRDVKKFPTPVFLWCDEAQYFINPYDQIFLTTARSSRTATVFLSQNISNYLAVMGSGSDAKARVDSLMGNLCTKIFHANSDAETNEYASKLIGNTLKDLSSTSEQFQPFALFGSKTRGSSASYNPQLEPHFFTTLKTGGYENNFNVQCVMAVSGRIWSDKLNFIKLTFKQDFKTLEDEPI